jgi:hypothetical protein
VEHHVDTLGKGGVEQPFDHAHLAALNVHLEHHKVAA